MPESKIYLKIFRLHLLMYYINIIVIIIISIAILITIYCTNIIIIILIIITHSVRIQKGKAVVGRCSPLRPLSQTSRVDQRRCQLPLQLYDDRLIL